MASFGAVRDCDYQRLTKVQSFHSLMGAFPRGILPTDIDGMVEENRNYLFFESKTEGAAMPYGQALSLERLIADLQGKAVLLVGEHPPLSKVEPAKDYTTLSVWFWEPSWGCVRKTAQKPLVNRDLAWFCLEWAKHCEGLENSFFEVVRGAFQIEPQEFGGPK